MDRPRARRQIVPALFSVLTIAVAGLAVWLPAVAQRHASDRIFAETRSIGGMLTAMLDQETGLRGYALTRQPVFLEPYRQGRRSFDDQLIAAHRAVGGDTELRDRIAAAADTARTWQSDADQSVAAVARGDSRSVVRAAVGHKAIMDRFRAEIAGALKLVEERRRAEQSRAQTIPVIAVTLLSALFLLLAYRVVLRPRIEAERAGRRERRYAQAQHEFTETMQMAGDEDEAHTLLKRHLERTLPDAEAVVLKRNNSENRLEPGTESDDERLAEILAGTDARSCLSIRYGRRHHEGVGADPLLSCALCRSIGREGTTCVPSLVGGQVIGSVLLLHEQPLEAEAEGRLRESVTQAGPVLANLRTIARAERRAATDALTGLPNARAVQDTLTRMAAQSGRSLTPLTAIMIDLDRFKALNDDFGHEVGNDVLAAAAQTLQGTLRASDFVGRYGGEEFVALLPDTDREGGIAVAEKLRLAMTQVRVAGVERGVTASFGVATLPQDAPDGPGLLRQADRALYRAKELGRNRVETATQAASRA